MFRSSAFGGRSLGLWTLVFSSTWAWLGVWLDLGMVRWLVCFWDMVGFGVTGLWIGILACRRFSLSLLFTRFLFFFTKEERCSSHRSTCFCLDGIGLHRVTSCSLLGSYGRAPILHFYRGLLDTQTAFGV